jgi:hypothetical protein
LRDCFAARSAASSPINTTARTLMLHHRRQVRPNPWHQSTKANIYKFPFILGSIETFSEALQDF